MSINLKDRIESSTEIITVQKLYDMLVISNTLNPDPLYQRNSTVDAYQCDKNVGIILSIFQGFGIDTIIVRDISVYEKTAELRKLYPYYKYLVVDGGHRCRAVKYFMMNKFAVNINGEEKCYSDLSEEERELFLNASVLMKYVVCTSEQARQLFLAINKMTKTNEIETIMADDVNPVCRWIREHTWNYREYKNKEKVHPIFKVGTSDKFEYETEYWNKPNTGGSFFYHSFITLAKAIGRGNVNAGQRVWEKLVADEVVITEKDEETWIKFFDDLLEYQDIVNHSSKINDEIFGFFSCVWFELLSRYGLEGFRLDMETFAKDLAKKRAELTSKVSKSNVSKYDSMLMKNIDGVDTDVKTLIREYVKAFSHGDKQSFAGRFILSEMGEEMSDFGVIVLDTRKNPSKKDRELMLQQQGSKCFIDKMPLKLKDAHAAHIVARADGGVSDISNYRMVRKAHNIRMGTMNLNEYVKVYEKEKKYA